ncbi:MAG TPA: DPP IV N-terminal domain-containing protein [Gemmatimonadales bacterium]|nr:DPP IV N-terminal domain-containing protein [Gemmatimonadales bacterium]
MFLPLGAFRRHFSAVLLLAVILPGTLPAQNLSARREVTPVTEANYRLGARFAPMRMSRLVHSTTVTPRWIQGSERFWYEYTTAAGKKFLLVDPMAGIKREMFDNDRIAAELTRITRDPYDGQNLPIRAIRFVSPTILHFEVESSQDEVRVDEEAERGQQQDQQRQGTRARPKKKVHYFSYNVITQELRELTEREEPDNHPSWANVSPDGETIVFARNHNLRMMTRAAYQQVLDARRGKTGAAADTADWAVEVEEVALTTDGVENYSYATGDFGMVDEEKVKSKDRRKRANVVWAHNSQRFSLIRSDQRKSLELWVIHSTGNKRPQLETYKYDMPGETTVAQQELVVYDLPARRMVKVEADQFKDQRLGVFTARQFNYPDANEPNRSLWLSASPNEVWFWRRSRDQHKVDVVVANATTGSVRVVIEERLNTYVEHERLELLGNGDLLWWSERDGWGHIYRFGNDGTLKNRLTEGPWRVSGIQGIDETRGVVYLSGNAREPGEDPYYQHTYRVGLNGQGLTLVNPGAFDHRTTLGESNRFAVHNYSRVDLPPRSAVVDVTTGRKVLDLEEGDFSRLMEAGYQFPEPFTVKAADGITDLYGVMYKPFDFDPTKQYPIVAYVYPGPQTESVAKSFTTSPTEVGLAQFGMIVITIGNRGGHPDRSKWYHNFGYGNLRDYGLADKKTAIEQLADRHEFIDIDRVGIYGHSGGGFMSTAAMLVYPDFFKVAVSSAGNHENNIYNANWSEKHHGIKEVTRNDTTSFEYSIATNSQLARNLKGRLLLTTGDIDNNVHPAATYRMAESLIRANKRFDFFIFPGQRHGFGNMSDYWYWLRAEYFVTHLLGDSRWNANITELDVEKEQTGR